MASEPLQTVTPEQLMALKGASEALKVICSALQVKEMGPADHIRTKHEIKQFIQLGNIQLAASLIENADQRRLSSLKLKMEISNRVHASESRKI